MRDIELLPESARILVRQILNATVRNGEWEVLTTCTEPATSRQDESSPEAGLPLTPQKTSSQLRKEILAILERATGGLTTHQIIAQLQNPAHLQDVRKILFSAGEVAIGVNGGWVYSPEGVARPVQETERLVSTGVDPGMGDQPPVRRLNRFALREEALRILEEADCPLGTEMLVARIGGGVDSRAVKEALAADRRFMRSDVDVWAVTAWGLRPYSTVKDLVAEELDKAGGAIEASRLVSILTREFSIKESTLRQTMSSAPFCVRTGMVRRLTDVSAANGVAEQLVIEDTSTAGLSAEELMRMLGL
ncbi:hypothetical protein [Kitasatospora sp. NPDC058190]|uniref:hypothetical protein n=1 Tax=Kitasatospora sp. NPDC058190 TaxID=3346371 RepID=UPI0036DAEAA5